jgi:hypothetical protein
MDGMSNKNDNFGGNFMTHPLNREEIANIMKQDRLAKLCRRVEYGARSVVRSPLKALIVLTLIVTAVMAWLYREQIIKHIHPVDIVFPLTLLGDDILRLLFYWGFTYIMPAISLILLIVILGIFGVRQCARRWETAFITLRIYRSPKYPWLLDRRKKGIYWVYKILLNGSTKEDFESNKVALQTLVKVKLHKFENIGVDKMLIYATSDKKPATGKRTTDSDY